MKTLILTAACVVILAGCTQVRSQSSVNTSNATNAGRPVMPTSDSAATAPKVGESAPDFKLPYATQEQIYLKPDEYLSLSGQRGKNVILAFYPADWSGGCTKEVCTLRDTFAELSKLNATVLGISGDYVFSHQEWAKFHKLQFPLLSDHDHKVARAYNSYNEGAGYNKRTVFLIDKAGVVRYVNLEFKAGEAADYNRLKEELAKLK
ncbi:MAG TPA: peroxiredoxin [Pyrinomonadaceae bacterium]|nr:peroxiredoxin [Pyrinomonadaceae bacterium]